MGSRVFYYPPKDLETSFARALSFKKSSFIQENVMGVMVKPSKQDAHRCRKDNKYTNIYFCCSPFHSRFAQDLLAGANQGVEKLFPCPKSEERGIIEHYATSAQNRREDSW